MGVRSAAWSERVWRALASPCALDAVCFGPGGKKLLTVGSDRSLREWDAGTGRKAHELTGHRGPITSLAFGPGRRLASASEDSTALVWDVSR